MKKNYKWLINIAAICLCICAMAIGIYAAKQASLTATGTIGFTAHDCTVEVSGTIDAYAEGGSEKLTGDNATIEKQTVASEGLTYNFPAGMHFSDLNEGGDVITINLTITNKSAYT
ncbi:MAG: hypothetical protein E7376_02950, partial [Clostridiales bacterium]|nr:hypothetical protein [Clostridiales bacterium]